MADRGDTHYHLPSLNKWFLGSSLLLLVSTVWMVIDDWNAEWKGYQRTFRDIELDRANSEIDALSTAELKALEATLLEAKAAAEAALAENQEALDKAETEAYEVEEDRIEAEDFFKSAKADYNWARYVAEEYVTNNELAGFTDDQKAELDELFLEMNRTDIEFQDLTDQQTEADAVVEGLRKILSDAETAYSVQLKDLIAVRETQQKLDPDSPVVQLADFVRDAPGLDFIGPNMKVQKHVLSNLTFELNFTKKLRIDMCQTCHLAVDRDGYQTQEQPFTSHPRLDLYLSSNSPHPAKEIGCSICHRGSGESLSFQHVDHRPAGAAQTKEWEDEHHWHKQHHWDYPMLSSDYTEASCVQCHTDSMELIADDAPKLTEGYRLFERNGCYACHKVEWFPEDRKPGPSLKNLAAKITPEFADAWIANPKAFRPTTWMPQIFHLENFEPTEIVVPKPEWGKEGAKPIIGQDWNDTAVAAITSYLFQNHPKEAFPPVPPSGDATRGREAFRLAGCLACHNVAPFPGNEEQPLYEDMAFEAGEYNTKGPNLRGVATKVTAEWLHAWIKDPAAYWSETRMPDLHLPDQDVTDIVAYMMEDPDGLFMDTPDDWSTGLSPIDSHTLEEQARWFNERLGRREIQARLAGEVPEHQWNDEEVLLRVVGENFVRHQGCFSCHEIGGLESEMPIGTELTNWGSKTVDKLDFGMAYRKEVAGRPQLSHYYREPWLERKLHHPRSFDIDKVKNPKEKLRMPWFDFSDDEVEAMATFVVGLVDDEVSRARMVPTPEKAQMDLGLRTIRQKNCMACHITEPSTITFLHEGEEITVDAELRPLDYEVLPPKMGDVDDLKAYLIDWAEFNEEDEPEEVYARLLSASPEIGGPATSLAVQLEDLISMTPAQGGEFVPSVTNYYFHGAPHPNPDYDPNDPDSYPDLLDQGYWNEDEERMEVYDVDGVSRYYGEEDGDKVRWSFAPPVLLDQGNKVQRDWFFGFLMDPIPLRQQIRVPMPKFNYRDGEAEAVADYFAFKSRDEYPSRWAKRMRLTLGRTVREGAMTDAWAPGLDKRWPTSMLVTEAGGGLTIAEVAEGSGLSEDIIRGIENGSKAAQIAGWDKLREWGEAQGFRMTPPVAASYEEIAKRAPSYVALRKAFMAYGHALTNPHQVAEEAEEQGEVAEALLPEGASCFKCHFEDGLLPIQRNEPFTWAPDLAIVRERLREDWVMDWLWSPKRIYPGTTMPENFAGDEAQYQELYPGSDNEEQIHAVLDWLFNKDRFKPITD